MIICLLLLFPPGLIPENGFYMGIKGIKSASMLCNYTADNDENATVHWYKNDKELHSDDHYFIDTSVSGVSNLTIKAVGEQILSLSPGLLVIHV